MEEKSLAVKDTSIQAYAESLDRTLKVAQAMMKSGLVPQSFKSPEAVCMAVWFGQELGFSPIRSLHLINVIQGKCTLSAEGYKAKAIEHGAVIESVKWTESECTLKCTRGKWSETFTYTMDDAKRQGLSGKDNWQKLPKQMLYARCSTTLIRNMFADVLGGVYTTEEMEDAVYSGKTVDITPEKPVIPPSVKPADDLSPKPIEQFWAYDLSLVPEAKRDQAKDWSLKAGCHFDETTGLFVSASRLTKLDKYQVQGIAKIVDGKLEITKPEANGVEVNI